MKIGAELGEARFLALVRDKNGRPKIDDNQLIRFWPHISEEDKKFLQERYDIISKQFKEV